MHDGDLEHRPEAGYFDILPRDVRDRDRVHQRRSVLRKGDRRQDGEADHRTRNGGKSGQHAMTFLRHCRAPQTNRSPARRDPCRGMNQRETCLRRPARCNRTFGRRRCAVSFPTGRAARGAALTNQLAPLMTEALAEGPAIEVYTQTRSILGSVRHLYLVGSTIAAVLILLFSVIVPSTKAVLVLWTVLRRDRARRARTLGFVEIIAR